MEINLPDVILSNEFGYNSLVKIYNNCKDIKDSSVFFNFLNVRFIEANLCAILGSIVENLILNKNDCHFVNTNKEVESILLRNGFRSYYFNQIKSEDIYQTTVQYKAFHHLDSDDMYEEYVINELITKNNFPEFSEDLKIKILENIFEIFVNAKTHGKCEYIHSCGQFFPNRSTKPLNFTIVDLGINIKENINVNLNNYMDACNAIKWAMVEGNTTKINEPGGLGLSVVLSFIELNGGKFEIVSSNGYYKFSRGTIKTSILDYEFPGTIVNFTFHLNDSNSYILK